MSTDNRPSDYWSVRRKLAVGTLSFCYVTIAFLLVNGTHDSKLHAAIASSVLVVLTGTIVGYIGTSVYDDIGDKELLADKDYWLVRRRIVIVHSVYSALCVAYLLLYGVDNSKLQVSMISDIMLTTTIAIVSYIGGASIQDKYMKKIK